MSRKDAILIASRTLSVFFTVWALTEISYLPEFLHSYLRYNGEGIAQTEYVHYMHHYHLLRLGFLITRIIGYALLARWLYKGGRGVEEVLFPAHSDKITIQGGEFN
jgi:hypothetical protein